MFPKLLSKATFKHSSVCFDPRDLENDDTLIELLEWKTTHRIHTLSLRKLKALHGRGLFTKDIHRLFSNNGRLDYLAR